MTDSTTRESLRVVEVTRSQFESGQAFNDWDDSSDYARIGGSFGELLLSSPVRDPRNDDPLLLAALLGNRPVGSIVTINGLIHIGTQACDVLWCSGLSVLPEFRNTGAGLMILLRLRSKPVASGAVCVSKAALPLYSQLGWRHIAADRHLLIRHSAPILMSWIQRSWLATPLSWLVDVPLLLHRLVLAAWLQIRFRGFRVEQVERLPEELDPQISGLIRPVKCHRSTRWINWAMKAGPQRNSRRLYLVKDRTGRAVAYFMTGLMQHDEADGGRIRNIRLASVLDWMNFDDQAMGEAELLLLALRTLLDARADAIELCVPEPQPGRALRKLGLLRKGALNMVIRFPAGTPGISGLQFNAANVWFRPADADGFVN